MGGSSWRWSSPATSSLAARGAALPAALLLGGLLAACSGPSAAARSSASTAAAARNATVDVRGVQGLGNVLVDGDGFALYAYVPDHKGASRCYGECPSVWPPLVLPRALNRPAAGSGVVAARLGTTKRRSGERQITYDGWPLYLSARDHGPGVAAGQGDTMGLWYVLHPDGSVDRQGVRDA